MAVIRTLSTRFDLRCPKASCRGLVSEKHPAKSRTFYGYQKVLNRGKDLDLGICLPGIIPNTFLAQAVLEQSLEEAIPTIKQGNRTHTSSLLRFRDASFVQPRHFQSGDYWRILLLLL